MTAKPTRADLEAQLLALACNYRWTWDIGTQQLFDDVRNLAGAPGGHPMTMIPLLDDADWEGILSDDAVVAAIVARHAELHAATSSAAQTRTIAYFSPEFGISETLPQYSGGLGILAGDHLKAASDTEVPLAGIGLFYREGFFRQLVSSGHQQEWYQTQQADALGLRECGVRVPIDLGNHVAWARVWRADIGATPLYLLDTDVPENSARDRSITNRLYSGDQEHRLRQELVLGMGGARALAALGISPRCFHLNEGHAGLLILELLSGYLGSGLPLAQAISAVRPLTVFTTHTPVPAGIDRFPRSLFARYVEPWAERHGVDFDELFKLGILPSDNDPDTFNMAAFCLNIAGRANGVSQLHGEVSRDLFEDLSGGKSIGSVTNGVHARTWVGAPQQRVFDEHLGRKWADGDEHAWSLVKRIPDDEVREFFADGRRKLIDMCAARSTTAPKLDPHALTIGFARRFATYKRASLLLLEAERLCTLLADDDQPVQFVFAGKAHPADQPGKALLAQVTEFAQAKASRGRFVFVTDYDMEVARIMYAGCDVWLNNPVRPLEACGTSGMKAALNGALNLSILDGWWNEWYDGDNGWAIPTSDDPDPASRDVEESSSLLSLLENEVVPLFHAGGNSCSAQWLNRVRHNWISLGPRVTASRMVREYRDRLYK